jgi:Escherichia/Staphylococcus phage prohead protease
MNDTTLIADIEGYASVFSARDMNGDVMERGAFARSLNINPAVRMLYQHAAETPIGRWTSFREDEYGLFVTGEILLASPRAREVHALLEGGAIDGLSIGFQTVRARKDKTGGRSSGRRIIEAELWEVSIVTFPMARTARITHVGRPRPETSTTIHSTDPARATPPMSNGALSASLDNWARPARRALVPPPASARHFADALRSAAAIISV